MAGEEDSTFIDHLRQRAKADPGAPPVLFVKIELGGRFEDLAVYNPDLLLDESATGTTTRLQFLASFQEKLLAVARAGIADRSKA